MDTILYHRFVLYEPLTKLSERWSDTLGLNATEQEVLSEQRVLRLALDTWSNLNSFELTDDLVLWYNTVVVAMADASTENEAKQVVKDGYDRLVIQRLVMTDTGGNVYD